MYYPHLFSPFTIKGHTYKNRIICAPLCSDRMVQDGIPTDEGINAYENRARGGCAGVVVTETAIDYDRACRHDNGFNFVKADKPHFHEESLCVLAEAIQSHDCVATVEIAHVGELNHPIFIRDGKNPIGPTGRVREDGIVVEEMDEAMMNEVADRFADAAYAVMSYGFDGVMVHGAHGWLLHQFVSPLTNHRTDRYGGSMENRARFPRMVLQRIRDRCGKSFLIEYRLSVEEFVPGGFQIGDTIEFIRYIKDLVDMISCSAGLYHSPASRAFPSMFLEPGCNAEYAAKIKTAYPDMPVAVVGGINDPAVAEDIIAKGQADFVLLGRQMMADPDFPIKAMTGRADEIAPCMRCSCFIPLPIDPLARLDVMVVPKPFECTANPKSFRELRMQTYPKPEKSRRVLVIGGGCAGMYAAVTACERGHKVILVEKNERLGGLLNFAEHDIYKRDLFRYRSALVARVMHRDIEVRLNTEATAELIREVDPFVTIVAVGSRPTEPTFIAGAAEHGVCALDAYDSPEMIGQNVVMIGGGLVGCETALHLAALGRKVTVLEMAEDVAVDAFPAHKQALMPKLAEDLAAVCTEMRCTRVEADGVYAQNRDGVECFFPCDTAVYAVGMTPNHETVDALRGVMDNFSVVGDCRRPAKVLEAVKAGYFAAMDIL